jgi:hypothetical protein
LWYRKADDHDGYDYLAMHVDDIAIAATRPMAYMDMIEQEFLVRNKEDSPSNYLGNDLKTKPGSNLLHISNKTYIKEVIWKYQEEHRTLPKKNIPTMLPNAHPELDTTELLDEEGNRQYQKIIGMGQWLMVAGHFDINFAVSSLLSRYAAAPQQGNLIIAEDVLGYLKKYPARGYIVTSKRIHCKFKATNHGTSIRDDQAEGGFWRPISIFS